MLRSKVWGDVRAHGLEGWCAADSNVNRRIGRRRIEGWPSIEDLAMVCPGQSSLEVSLVSIMPVWWQETRRFGTAGDDRFLRSFDRTGCDQSSHHPSAVARHDAAILLASAASPLADTRASHAHAHRCSPLELLSPRIAFVAPPPAARGITSLPCARCRRARCVCAPVRHHR
jgi:hypothetical protein